MSGTHRLGSALALVVAAAAFAQPASFTDLGNHSTTAHTFTQAVTLTAPADIQWFRMVLPANSAVDGWVDIWTTSAGANPMTDTEIGLYDNAGNLINSNDDDNGLMSLLSFGQNSPPRAAHGTGAQRVGQHGTLAGGTYWLACGRFNVNFFQTNWDVQGQYTGTQTTTLLNFEVQPPGSPIPPSGTMTLSPNHGVPGDVFTAEVTVTPGANPLSTGITVRLDASAVDAGSAIVLHDDGLPPDNFAGDNIFAGNVTVGTNAVGGPHTLTATIRDAQNRSGSTQANFVIPMGNDDCSGAVAAVVGNNSFDNTGATTDGTASCGGGGQNDVWYTFHADQAGQYIIATCGGAAFDTVLSAFDGCGGNELACNDDTCGLQSQIAVSLTAGQNILIRVAGYFGATGIGTFSITYNAPAQWDETLNGGSDAGELLASAQVPAGSGALNSIGGALSGNDTDLYKIRICEPSSFSATTDSADTTGDTQLWLFSEDGHGVQFNDDTVGLHSAFGAEFVSTAGIYYIGVSQYNRDAVDEFGQLIWNNTPFAGVRAPDGPGAANTLNGWTGGTGGLNYRITMTGACFAGCAADFNADGVVDFFDYLDFVQAFAGNQASADFNHDGVIDFFDYLDFVQAFAAGC